jgi:uncharacterized membrane protein YdfJ with MMPL/SSD domain
MRGLMTRLSLTRRRWWVLGAWLVVVAISVPASAKQTDYLVGGGFTVPGSQSQAVESSLSTDFQPDQSAGIGAVLQASPGATPVQRAAAVDRLAKAVTDQGQVQLSPADEARARAQLQRKGVTIVPLHSSLPASDLTDPAGELRDSLDPGSEQDGVTPYLSGQPAAYAGLQELSKQNLAVAEGTGFPLVAVILLAVFGSAAAASLPLALGLFSVVITGALIFLLSQQIEMSVFVTNMASMLGIGVAVDYSLFIVARYREEVRAGAGPAEARAKAFSTSGLAVVFSGIAVVISLAGLFMIDNQALRSMALGAMIVVAVAVLVAATLLPVLIRVLGDRVESGGVVLKFFNALGKPFGRRRGSAPPDRLPFWQRWTERVMKRPLLSIALSGGFLLILAIPALSMETGNSAIEQFPADHDVRVGSEIVTKETGGGENPIQVLASFHAGDLSNAANAVAASSFVATVGKDPEADEVTPAESGRDDTALISVTPKDPSESDQALALMSRVRAWAPASALGTAATVDVGGESARLADVRDQINGSMWKIIAFILALSFVALMVMLRSVVLPLKAILMNLLSIGAAYGVLVVVFQYGWLDGITGFDSLGRLDTINPPLILAVVFGLSMDYEVFLLSRIRERYEVHGDNRRAVAEGLSSSARTISSAALIMTVVFAIFVLTGVPSIKELGLGCAVAIALDATLVRLILVPAAMQVLGDWNWWLPDWLDRLLPDLNYEAPAAPSPPTAETVRA